jgi:hypothetical protein
MDLFAAVADDHELGDEGRPQILAIDGPGWSPDDPMTLIVKHQRNLFLFI